MFGVIVSRDGFFCLCLRQGMAWRRLHVRSTGHVVSGREATMRWIESSNWLCVCLCSLRCGVEHDYSL